MRLATTVLAMLIFLGAAGIPGAFASGEPPAPAQALAAANPAGAPARDSATARCDWSDQDYLDFYAPPDLGELAPGRLGELLRVEHIQSYTARQVADAAGVVFSAYGAEVYRVLYLSQAPEGVARAVSGLMVVPTGLKPPGGYPVISDGHGTSGLADTCAPSKFLSNIPALLSWVLGGYIVSATDYHGLGTPGSSPYTVGEGEAFSLLDGARAGLRFCDTAHGFAAPVAADQVFIEGQSQGGHAALFAQQYSSTYAPELNIVGTVTFAPGSEPRTLAELVATGEVPLVGPMAMAVYSYRQYYGEPESLAGVLKEPYASEMPYQIENKCLLGMTLWLGFSPDRVFQPDLLLAIREGRWEDIEPWTGFLDTNTPGNFRSSAPVLVLQGQLDGLVPPKVNEQLTARLCRYGTQVQFRVYPGKGHMLASTTRPDALAWMADRLAGKPMISSCRSVPAVYLPLVAK